MSEKEYFTVEQVAQRFGVTPKTIYRLAQQGEIPGFKVGNQWRFNEDQLKSWEDKQSGHPNLHQTDSNGQ